MSWQIPPMRYQGHASRRIKHPPQTVPRMRNLTTASPKPVSGMNIVLASWSHVGGHCVKCEIRFSTADMHAFINWVIACCVLHNMLARLGDAWAELYLEEDVADNVGFDGGGLKRGDLGAQIANPTPPGKKIRRVFSFEKGGFGCAPATRKDPKYGAFQNPNVKVWNPLIHAYARLRRRSFN